jgi:D-galactarolactone isomerase
MTGPKLQVPKGATDTHMHFYGPFDRYPFPADAQRTAPEALLVAYREVQARLGLERVVVVQAAGYRFDNAATMANVEALGEAARAVVVVPLGTPEAELERLTKAGARGLRVFMLDGGVYDWTEIPALADMVRPFGWHLQLQLDGRELIERLDFIENLNIQLVIDHTGKFLEPVEPDHPAFQCLKRLVHEGAYVKLSAPYETSKLGPPTYDDVGTLAKILVREAPDRMLWATNWPHPGHAPKDEAMLLDTLLDWAPDPHTQRLILTDNPARLYGFPKAG